MIEVTPTFAIGYYILILIGYLVYKTMHIPEGPGDQQIVSPVVGGLFVAAVLVGEYMISIGMIKTTCGFEQWEFGALVTFLPWVGIVGLLTVVLIVRPGWLVPFSNTFGYSLATAFFGLSDTFKKLMRPRTSIPNEPPQASAPPLEQDAPEPSAPEPSAPPLEQVGGQNATMDVERALQEIYEDESLLINQITPENIDAFITRYTNAGIILKPSEFMAIEPGNTKDMYLSLITKIRTAVYFKLFVSEFIWLLLSGILVISITFNYIVNYGCKMTPEQIAEKEAKLAALAAAQSNADDAETGTTKTSD
jgi:hypothetical protein